MKGIHWRELIIQLRSRTGDREISNLRKPLTPLGWWDKGEGGSGALRLGAPQRNGRRGGSNGTAAGAIKAMQPMLETAGDREARGETARLLLPSHSPASLPAGHAQPEPWETQPIRASPRVMRRGERGQEWTGGSHTRPLLAWVIITSHMPERRNEILTHINNPLILE